MAKMKEVKKSENTQAVGTRIGSNGLQTFFKGKNQVFGREAREASKRPSKCIITKK